MLTLNAKPHSIRYCNVKYSQAHSGNADPGSGRNLNNATARAFRAESSLGRQFDATIDARMAAKEALFSQPQLNNHLPSTGPQPPSGTTPEEMADNV